MGDGQGRVPTQIRKCLPSLGGLRAGDQEGETACRGQQPVSYRQDGFEVLDSAQGDRLECAACEGFGADVLYIDLRQCKGASDLAEKSSLLMVGFNEREGDVRRPEFDGKAGESCAGAEIGHGVKSSRAALGQTAGGGCLHWKQDAGGEEALAEVAGDDVFGVANRSEIDAGVPAD